MLCYGGILRKWQNIVRFFITWGYAKISAHNPSMAFVKNWWQPWTSLKRVINSSNSLLSCPSCPSQPPNIHLTTPLNHANATGEELIAVMSFIKYCPQGQFFQIQAIQPSWRILCLQFDLSDSTSITSMSPEYCGCVKPTQFSNKGKQMIQ